MINLLLLSAIFLTTILNSEAAIVTRCFHCNIFVPQIGQIPHCGNGTTAINAIECGLDYAIGKDKTYKKAYVCLKARYTNKEWHNSTYVKGCSFTTRDHKTACQNFKAEAQDFYPDMADHYPIDCWECDRDNCNKSSVIHVSVFLVLLMFLIRELI